MNLKQIVICREGKCVDLYYNKNFVKGNVKKFVECESLKDNIFEVKQYFEE